MTVGMLQRQDAKEDLSHCEEDHCEVAKGGDRWIVS
jgi:hypothetical protein